MADLIVLLYNHQQSRPKLKHTEERSAAFLLHTPLSDIHFVHPCLSAWATQLVGKEAYYAIGHLAKVDCNDPDNRTHIHMKTNGRLQGTEVVSWDRMNFTIDGLAEKYKLNAQLPWFLTQCMAAPHKHGVPVLRERHLHPVSAAISSFILSRNHNANGDLAMPLGIWHFACKSHVDVKCVYSRFGSIVSDTTARNTLDSMTEVGLNALREKVADATERGETEWGRTLTDC
ncbi:hypothetical protein C8J57DRAFT_1440220 [Mycena rebaudengoi]|nr:hypothetical protein C8J57DRAFT_1440220 [Mycena rebaudengoi]